MCKHKSHYKIKWGKFNNKILNNKQQRIYLLINNYESRI